MSARSTKRELRVIALASAAGLFAAVLGTLGQGAGLGAAQAVDPATLTIAEPGAPGTPGELRAWNLVREDKLIEAREAAEEVVAADPNSYVAHFVLGYVYHYAEASFPRALFHENRARALFEARHGNPPRDAWRWHARILRELAATHGDLEHHRERLALIEEYNELYDPDVLAESAWAMMKLGRYDEARRAAQSGIESGDPRQLEIALNALCAIEFEAGDDDASYAACRRALDHARMTPGEPNAVDLTNFAEAARAAFHLAEAEEVLLEATRAPPAWYGNPWLELAELYTRGARFPEALDALRRVNPYRAQRPPHVRDSDLNEGRRALAAFFLTVGKAREALDITDKAIVTPDRRGHNSRDPAQDRAVVALLDRLARRTVASMDVEAHAAAAAHDRLWAHLGALSLRFEAWRSGRQAVRLLADDERLVGTCRLGSSKSAIMPPWLIGELVDVMGAGVMLEALRRAKAEDGRELAAPYYDAIGAEAALARGDEARAIELAQRARSTLGQGEALLRARVDAVHAEAVYRTAGAARAASQYELALGHDPGVFRRLGFAIPVRVRAQGDEVASDLSDAVARSPRFVVEGAGLEVRIEATAADARVCLHASSGTVLHCSTTSPRTDEDLSGYVQRALDDFHAGAFAPRIDLSQGDIHGLDGSNRVARDPLEGLTR